MDLPSDHAIRTVLLKTAQENNIKYILNGRQFATEGILPIEWSYGPFDWKYTEDPDKIALREHYKKLIKIRKENSCLRTGSFDTIMADGMVYSFSRHDNEGTIIVIVNNDTNIHKIKIPINSDSVLNLLNNEEYVAIDGFISLEL